MIKRYRSGVKVQSGVNTRTTLEISAEVIATETAQRIVERHLPSWLALFLEKNAKYKKVDNALGTRGVFPDVYRKVGILRDRVWDGRTSPGESTREVIKDLIGHLFLMLDYLDEPEPADEQPAEELDATDRAYIAAGVPGFERNLPWDENEAEHGLGQAEDEIVSYERLAREGNGRRPAPLFIAPREPGAEWRLEVDGHYAGFPIPPGRYTIVPDPLPLRPLSDDGPHYPQDDDEPDGLRRHPRYPGRGA